ncbi:hypothetical protein OIE67_26745 [Nonomuraea fuscirosea]|jgi:hypothetical protein|uniref:hypothetical protein n=1 Tax=Nonomuraea fuscirosea TaxID=1291556 RepID=UPI002DDB50A8|nr:hypothetical protein [Nonomuraea fuscirosea]WSA58094.1 hypothetical protein OIE67_26745 [Nonomuraea fuscirosea]
MGKFGRAAVAAIISGAALAASCASPAQAATGTETSSAAAAECYASSGNLYCGNAANALIYASPGYTKPGGNPETVVDRLLTTVSYFKCYVSGQRHGGGNSIWYYTYGDVTGRWGYVAAVNVWTSTDPYPGVAHC